MSFSYNYILVHVYTMKSYIVDVKSQKFICALNIIVLHSCLSKEDTYVLGSSLVYSWPVETWSVRRNTVRISRASTLAASEDRQPEKRKRNCWVQCIVHWATELNLSSFFLLPKSFLAPKYRPPRSDRPGFNRPWKNSNFCLQLPMVETQLSREEEAV